MSGRCICTRLHRRHGSPGIHSGNTHLGHSETHTSFSQRAESYGCGIYATTKRTDLSQYIMSLERSFAAASAARSWVEGVAELATASRMYTEHHKFTLCAVDANADVAIWNSAHQNCSHYQRSDDVTAPRSDRELARICSLMRWTDKFQLQHFALPPPDNGSSCATSLLASRLALSY